MNYELSFVANGRACAVVCASYADGIDALCAIKHVSTDVREVNLTPKAWWGNIRALRDDPMLDVIELGAYADARRSVVWYATSITADPVKRLAATRKARKALVEIRKDLTQHLYLLLLEAADQE